MEIGSDGSVGLITYMRTDSTRVSPEALEGVRARTSRPDVRRGVCRRRSLAECRIASEEERAGRPRSDPPDFDSTYPPEKVKALVSSRARNSSALHSDLEPLRREPDDARASSIRPRWTSTAERHDRFRATGQVMKLRRLHPRVHGGTGRREEGRRGRGERQRSRTLPALKPRATPSSFSTSSPSPSTSPSRRRASPRRR